MDRRTFFRNRQNIRSLAGELKRHHITDVFPHLCPTSSNGVIPKVNDEQAEQFLEGFKEFRVLPWVGGSTDGTASPEKASWRANFVRSVSALLAKHPRMAGIHLNIEPCPDGSEDLFSLLDDLRRSLPKGKMLSIAAYPPPTVWQRSTDVHWGRAYYAKVASRVDQMVVMMYDTSIHYEKPYRSLMCSWTQEVLDWSAPTKVLLALPAYEDEGVGYHDPSVENLQNALLGIHAGLSNSEPLPQNYQGIAVYCEWEMNPEKWRTLEGHFLFAGI